jgi:hypothetical protein
MEKSNFQANQIFHTNKEQNPHSTINLWYLYRNFLYFWGKIISKKCFYYFGLPGLVFLKMEPSLKVRFSEKCYFWRFFLNFISPTIVIDPNPQIPTFMLIAHLFIIVSRNINKFSDQDSKSLLQACFSHKNGYRLSQGFPKSAFFYSIFGI